MIRLFDRSNPCCITESGLPDFSIFNDNKTYSKSTGELIRDEASAFRYELGKVYNEKLFDQLTGRVLPRHYWLDPQFVSYLLALMFQVTIILIGQPYTKPGTHQIIVWVQRYTFTGSMMTAYKKYFGLLQLIGHRL